MGNRESVGRWERGTGNGELAPANNNGKMRVEDSAQEGHHRSRISFRPASRPPTQLTRLVVRVRPSSSDLRAMIHLALPVAGVQLGIMAMGVVDTIMVGHVSPTALEIGRASCRERV